MLVSRAFVSKEAPDAIEGGPSSTASLLLRLVKERLLNATQVEASLIGCARDTENGCKLLVGERVVSLADEQAMNGDEANGIKVKRIQYKLVPGVSD